MCFFIALIFPVLQPFSVQSKTIMAREKNNKVQSRPILLREQGKNAPEPETGPVE
jgi:hypothetical protein